MEGLGLVRCSAVSLGPTGQVVPTGRVVTDNFQYAFLRVKHSFNNYVIKP